MSDMNGEWFSKHWEEIAAILAVVVSVFSIWNAYRIHKKTSFINIVTSERVKRIDKLRGNISSFCGLSYHWALTNKNIEPQKNQEIVEEFDKLRSLIKLQLNPKEEEYESIV